MNEPSREEIQKLLETLKCLGKTKILICGHPDYIEQFKIMVEDVKEEFSDYIFEYYSSKEFAGDTLYLVPCEERTKPLFGALKITYVDENGDIQNV